MHPDMILTPKFNVGDKVWFIDRSDKIGRAVRGTVIEADVGSYRVKCDDRDDCKGHYLSPYEMFKEPEKAYDREIGSVESSIEINEESIKDAQVTIEKEKKVLAILKARKEDLGRTVWVLDENNVPMKMSASDAQKADLKMFASEKVAWEHVAQFYRDKFVMAALATGDYGYLVYRDDCSIPNIRFVKVEDKGWYERRIGFDGQTLTGRGRVYPTLEAARIARNRLRDNKE